jgi:UDP-N-acetylglucosamine acyltransferase
VGHNVLLGDHVILVNGALLGGHVTIGDRALISGNCLVHQFVRVGTLALMQGGAAISKDLPPFTVARGDNGMCGLNAIGLRRAGFDSQQRLELKELYHALFRSGRSLRAACVEAQTQFTSPAARLLLEFLASGTRGFCRDTGNAESDDSES